MRPLLLALLLPGLAGAAPAVIVGVGDLARQTNVVTVIPGEHAKQPGDVYIGAVLPNGEIFTLTPTSGWQHFDMDDPVPYTSGELRQTSATLTQDANVTDLAGTVIVAGYGLGPDRRTRLNDMLANGRYAQERVQETAAGEISVSSACSADPDWHGAQWIPATGPYPISPYVPSANVWGVKADPGLVSRWSQCISATYTEQKVKAFAASWDYETSVNGVKAYPEIYTGPLRHRSLPIAVASLASTRLATTGRAHTTCNARCSYASFYDMFFLDTARPPSTWPGADAEIMVWTRFEGRHPTDGGVPKVGVAVIDGIAYDIYSQVRDNTLPAGMAPKKLRMNIYVVRNADREETTDISLNLSHIIRDAVDRGLVDGSHHLYTVEFGTEVVSGAGTLTVQDYQVRFD